MTTDLLHGLNEQQRAAITAGLGPVLVLAGPGSGKTRVLTHRIAYLIQEMGVPAQAILAVTFTNKAAGEMRHRISGLIGERMRGLQVGTFHALCARWLRREGDHTPFGRDYLIYDTDDQEAVVKQALAELNIDPKKFSPRRMLDAISSAKNELVKPSQYKGTDYITEINARVYTRYQAILLDNNALDFDDLLMQMVILLQEDDTMREKYQRFLEFVLVDEFQDTNTAQYELVRLLGAPQNNILVVGDEDQGIYAFRGADYRNVLNFRRDYPTAQVILLEQNYRSTQVVLDAARAIIDKNPNRTPKALFTTREGGDHVMVYEAYSEEQEARYVIDQVESLYKKYKRWNAFAIMYRTNAQSRVLEEAFIREGIPYKLVGGVGFYKRKEVRDLISYMRFVHNHNDTVSFDRIINAPRRGIGKKTQAEFQLWAREECANYYDAFDRVIHGNTGSLSARTLRLFADFAMQLQRWRQLATENRLLELLDTIMSDVGFGLYIRQEISDTPEQASEREENVQELRGLVAQNESQGVTLADFLTELSLVADVDSLNEDADSVTLLTLHAAKGLEFPIVFITGLEEGLLPHSRTFDEPDGLAEERRLMYVGMTRAKDRLYLSWAFRRTMWGSATPSMPSRFLGDLPTALLDGMSPAFKAKANIDRFREETRWETPSYSSGVSSAGRSTAANSKMRDKIIPFPGAGQSAAQKPQSKFKSNDVVRHRIFGRGRVVESKGHGENEQVTVVFEDKKHGIKTLMAEYISMSDK
ncbi:MAG: UvrD-helicase domain-containing protein [Anaerolineae bacterium]